MEGKSIEKLVPVRVTESGKVLIALVRRTGMLCSAHVFAVADPGEGPGGPDPPPPPHV